MVEYREAIEWCEEHQVDVYFDGNEVSVRGWFKNRWQRIHGLTFLTAVMKAMKLEEDNETN